MSDFYSRGEAREALVAQSMLISNNWILPRAYNGSIPSKPPFFHWLAAWTSTFTGGLNEFSSRFPSAILAIVALCFFVYANRQTLGAKAQCIFILLLSFSFEWARASVATRVDMVHASFLSCGILSGFYALKSVDPRRWWLGLAVFVALATLGKGPVGIVIPALILGFWILIVGERRLSNLVRLTLCLSAAMLAALTWYLSAYRVAPQEFFARFWAENIDRFAGSDEQPHSRHAYYLAGMLLAGTLPWVPIIVWYHRKRKLLKISEVPYAWKTLDPLFQFCVLSATTIFVFYTIPGSKRGVYLLAAYPFLALLGAVALDRYWSWNTLRKLLTAGCLVTVAIQSVVVPRFVSATLSERDIGDKIRQTVNAEARIYSYGFEYYGASFYSGRTFYRYEDSLDISPGFKVPTPAVGDVILAEKKDLPELNALLAKNDHGYTVLAEARAAGKLVTLVRIANS